VALFAAVHESGFGTKLTCTALPVMSVLSGEADVEQGRADIR
jgi:hypothetical protein